MKSLYLFLFGLICLYCSCKSPKVITKSETVTAHDTVRIHTNSESQVNRQVSDSLNFYIAKIKTVKPECDSVTQSAIDKLLESFNVSKTSGENSYKFEYDQALRQLRLVIKMAETKNSLKDSVASKTLVLKTNTKTEIPVRLPLRWWERMFIVFGLVGLLFASIKLLKKLQAKSPI